MNATRGVVIPMLMVVSLAGCAWQSQVLRLNDDTWQVSANASPARGAGTGARRMALANANRHCEALGKTVEVTNIETEYAFPTNRVATVTFRCVDGTQQRTNADQSGGGGGDSQ